MTQPVHDSFVSYPDLLARVRDVTAEAGRRSFLREDLERAGVSIHERVGPRWPPA